MQWRQYEVVGEELPELNHHLAHNNDSVSQMVMQFRQFPSMVGLLMGLVHTFTSLVLGRLDVVITTTCFP